MTTPRFAILLSQFNEEVTSGLLAGAKARLEESGIAVAREDIFQAPGAFEMPLLAKKLAECGRFAGVICLGCVIKGDTAHFEFISLGAAVGLMQASLSTEVPLAFGILTTYTEEQAATRSRTDAHNKGREAAAACLASVETLAVISRLR